MRWGRGGGGGGSLKREKGPGTPSSRHGRQRSTPSPQVDCEHTVKSAGGVSLTQPTTTTPATPQPGPFRSQQQQLFYWWTLSTGDCAGTVCSGGAPCIATLRLSALRDTRHETQRRRCSNVGGILSCPRCSAVLRRVTQRLAASNARDIHASQGWGVSPAHRELLAMATKHRSLERLKDSRQLQHRAQEPKKRLEADRLRRVTLPCMDLVCYRRFACKAPCSAARKASCRPRRCIERRHVERQWGALSLQNQQFIAIHRTGDRKAE